MKMLDVSHLPSYRNGHHSLMWWGLMGLIVIEGTVFALTIAAYFFLRSQSADWPMGAASPDLLWGTINLAVLLASIWPNHWTKRAGEDGEERRIKLGLVVCALFGIVLLAIRVLEFRALNVQWDDNAYGSVVWVLLGLHTAHLLTDVYDTIVLAALFFFTKPIEGKRHVDVAENGMYWYFVVYAWIPVYGVIYWVPRIPA
jgi:cytochrome c oxidase subunit 3